MIEILQLNEKLLATGKELRCVAKASLISVFPAIYYFFYGLLNRLNAELNPICHLLALLRAHHIFHVSRIRVKRHC